MDKSYNGNETTVVKFQRRITPKVYRQEIQLQSSAHCLMMLYISMNFHENEVFFVNHILTSNT